MCIIRGITKKVSGTNILVGECATPNNNNNDDEKVDGVRRQLTVYANKVSLKKGTNGAMILPIPVGPCEFIDLSEYKNLFKDLNRLIFPPKKGKSRSRNAPRSASALEIVQVGSYKASIVPSCDDFARLQNDFFGVSEDVMSFLTERYANGWSFNVCLLDEDKEYHPFGYIHNMYGKNQLFCPTVHYHSHEDDSTTSDWDHSIYSINAPLKHAFDRAERFGASNRKGKCDSRDSLQRQISWNKLPSSIVEPTVIYGYRVENYNENHDCFSETL